MILKWRAESITVLCRTLRNVIVFLQTTSIFAWGLQFIQRTLPIKFFEGPMHKLKQFSAQN